MSGEPPLEWIVSLLGPYLTYIDFLVGAAVGAFVSAVLKLAIENRILTGVRRYLKRRALNRGGAISLEIREMLHVSSSRFGDGALPNAIDSYLEEVLRVTQTRLVGASREGETLVIGRSARDTGIRVRIEAQESDPRELVHEELGVLVSTMAELTFASVKEFIAAMRDEVAQTAQSLRIPGVSASEDLDSLSVVLHLKKEPRIIERFAKLDVSHMIARGEHYEADFSGKDVVFRGSITTKLPADVEEVLIQYG